MGVKCPICKATGRVKTSELKNFREGMMKVRDLIGDKIEKKDPLMKEIMENICNMDERVEDQICPYCKGRKIVYPKTRR